MRILFVLNTPGFVRYFDTTIRTLLDRGHDVGLAFLRPDLRSDALDAFSGLPVQPQVLGQAPQRTDRYAGVAAAIRAAVDYLRYFDPRFQDADYLRGRRQVPAERELPLLRRLRARRTLPRPVVRAAISSLLLCERALPSAPKIEAFIAAVDPDAVLVSPLVSGISPLADYVKSARQLGIPSGLCVASWDNLTNKGLMRERPDAVFVWNDIQVREAVELHRLPAKRVAVTGAQPFDRWFGRRPATSYEEFCSHAGLRADRPYVLFVGSTGNIARHEVEEDFIRRWVEALRASDDPLASELGVVVRPHPDRRGDWDAVELGGIDNAVLWPPRRPNSVLPEARSEYFDSIFHASAIVGINTSAMIEAAVVGRPVLTIRTPEFEQAQRGTLHFQYLLLENGGFLVVGGDLDEHIRQLLAAVRDPDRFTAQNERFVRSFVRPLGLDRACTEILVGKIEELAARKRRARRVPLYLAPLGMVLTLWARFRPPLGETWQERVARIRVGKLESVDRLRRHAARLEERAPWLAHLLEQHADRRAAGIDTELKQLRERLRREAKEQKRQARVVKSRAVQLLSEPDDRR